MKKTIVMSLGGSLIVPDEIDVHFLKNFKNIIEHYIKKDFRFIIYSGGGKIARKYQKAASEIVNISNEDLDWLGIHATKLNAQLIKIIFKNNAESVVFDNPNKKINSKKNIIIASGWLPGCSTDYDAVITAKKIKANEIINMSSIDYVYDKDPKKFGDAKPFYNISWKEYRKLIDSEWSAGLNSPFDPVASKEAEKLKLKVVIIGKDSKNLQDYLDGVDFKGTIIE